MAKHFVYRGTNGLYWSVDKGWVKYEWATVYTSDEVEKIEAYGGYMGGQWIPHDPPKPVPVIIGDNSECIVTGEYWCYFPETKTRLGVIHKIAGKSTFLKGYYYVYIPEPNWPA